MNNNLNILIIYPYFTPAKRAGGIVSSLNNLVDLLSTQTIYLYTSAYDLDGTSLNVVQNKWTVFAHNCKVFYATHDFKIELNAFVVENKIGTVYLNGVYGQKFFLKPLWQLRLWKKKESRKLIIAPRGMVQKGSLTIKPYKKKLYFTLLKLSGLLKRVYWHATDDQELIDVKSFFKTDKATLAIDSPTQKPSYITKSRNIGAPLRLIFLSLLTEKKNLLFLLKLLPKLNNSNLTLHIYGPIKDEAYWNECLSIISTLPNVHYCGEVPPTEVTQKMNEYDYFVLPTLGENFGHVIFESLVAGTPVIISDKTSWQHIDASQVGWVVPLEEPLWIERLESLATIKPEEYMEMSANCHRYIENYLSENNPVKEYEVLFG